MSATIRSFIAFPNNLKKSKNVNKFGWFRTGAASALACACFFGAAQAPKGPSMLLIGTGSDPGICFRSYRGGG